LKIPKILAARLLGLHVQGFRSTRDARLCSVTETFFGVEQAMSEIKASDNLRGHD
jgi:hypothetical protein